MNASSHAESAPKDASKPLGTIVRRVLVPGWILAGALFKLWERNPQLLPKPVTVFVKLAGIPRERYLDPAMRGMVAVEISAAIAIALGPARLGRVLSIALLALFCTILAILIASGAASCGCFGNSGPSPRWMLAIDGALLVAVMVLRAPAAPPVSAGGRTGALLGAAALVGTVTAFAVPPRAGVALQPADTEASAQQQPPTPSATNEPAPAVPATAAPWPPMPATAKPWYAPEFAEWTGKRLDSQELMLLVQRPLPANLNAGRHHVVLMREDCEHCHALLTKYFSGTLQTPTLTVAVPDATGELLENPCTDCGKAQFPAGITYVFSTPVLLTVQDGVVVGVCTDSENPEAVRAALNAK
jgi:hypothetical protein